MCNYPNMKIGMPRLYTEHDATGKWGFKRGSIVWYKKQHPLQISSSEYDISLYDIPNLASLPFCLSPPPIDLLTPFFPPFFSLTFSPLFVFPPRKKIAFDDHPPYEAHFAIYRTVHTVPLVQIKGLKTEPGVRCEEWVVSCSSTPDGMTDATWTVGKYTKTPTINVARKKDTRKIKRAATLMWYV